MYVIYVHTILLKHVMHHIESNILSNISIYPSLSLSLYLSIYLSFCPFIAHMSNMPDILSDIHHKTCMYATYIVCEARYIYILQMVHI